MQFLSYMVTTMVLPGCIAPRSKYQLLQLPSQLLTSYINSYIRRYRYIRTATKLQRNTLYVRIPIPHYFLSLPIFANAGRNILHRIQHYGLSCQCPQRHPWLQEQPRFLVTSTSEWNVSLATFSREYGKIQQTFESVVLQIQLCKSITCTSQMHAVMVSDS